MPGKQSDANAYLVKLGADKRATLEKVRKAIRAAAPKAEEGMSYGMPAFIQGKPLAGYAAGVHHCSYYPMSGEIIKALEVDLKDYETSKGAIRFPVGKPLPAKLIRKLVKARLQEIDAGAKPKKSAVKTSGAKAATGQPRRLRGDRARLDQVRLMAVRAKFASKTAPAKREAPPRDVDAVLRNLERNASKQFRADMSARYGIITKDKTFGTPMAKIKAIAKPIGKDHDFAEQLWRTGVYEARILASMVDEPERVTPVQMDRWAKNFDNWGVVDTLCFNLLDRTPHAFKQTEKWAKAKDEFVKRAAFALLACTALHNRGEEADFLAAMPLIEGAATDQRNFVKKGVSWALRAIGGKKSPKLRAAARALATRLAESDDPPSRWIGKDALRELAKKS